jgi:hypothetical protein
MMDSLDVDRIIVERITIQSIYLLHSRLIHKVIDETTNEMKEIIRENRELQSVEIWLTNKTNYLHIILENEQIEPASPAYITIKQISDAATHFVAEYRANKGVKTLPD